MQGEARPKTADKKPTVAPTYHVLVGVTDPVEPQPVQPLVLATENKVFTDKIAALKQQQEVLGEELRFVSDEVVPSVEDMAFVRDYPAVIKSIEVFRSVTQGALIGQVIEKLRAAVEDPETIQQKFADEDMIRKYESSRKQRVLASAARTLERPWSSVGNSIPAVRAR